MSPSGHQPVAALCPECRKLHRIPTLVGRTARVVQDYRGLPSFTAGDLAGFYKVDKKYAYAILDRLRERGLIKQVGTERNVRGGAATKLFQVVR